MPPRKHQFLRDATQGEQDDAEQVSRSQRKRDSLALQNKGEALAALSPARQAKLPLTPDLEQALQTFRGLSTHEARRRQLQYIGRLMREAEADGKLQAILDAWARLQ